MIRFPVKLIAFVLILGLMALPEGLSAKEKRGAEIVVTRTDGSQYGGELIAVKPDSLLLLAGGRDLSIRLADIRSVRIARRSRAKSYGGGLALTGIGLAAVLALGMEDMSGKDRAEGLLLGSLVFGGLGYAAGALLGSAAGQDLTFAIAGEEPALLAHYWSRLRDFSREGRLPREFAPPETKPEPEPRPQIIPPAVPPTPPPTPPPAAPSAPPPAPRRKPRFEISLGGLGYRGHRTVEGRAGQGSFRFPGDIPLAEAGPHAFGLINSWTAAGGLTTGFVRLGYAWKDHLTAEIGFYLQGRMSTGVQGLMSFVSIVDSVTYSSDFYGALDARFTGLLVGLTYRPLPPTALRRHIVELGAAAGPALASIAPSPGFVQSFLTASVRRVAFSGEVRAGYRFYIVPSMSLGLLLGYRYFHASYPGATISGDVWFSDVNDWNNRLVRPTEVTFPAFPVEGRGAFWGFQAGFRF